MTPKEQYILYISKHKLTEKAVPFTVAFDNNGIAGLFSLITYKNRNRHKCHVLTV